ncbi:MAG: phage tail tape measure protein [Planctomycetes bacterium]|nr:phage tail tape measure protein [Planctomycetota bacterium]
MASASGIRAGAAYVELYATDNRLVRGLNAAKARLESFSTSVSKIGQGFLKASALLAAPFVGGVKAFADVEQELANLRAAANPTAEEFQQIRAAVEQISRDTGIGPAQVASVFTELLKAGMGVSTVMNGAAEAALKFSRTGGLDAAQAAVVMSDALNAFSRDGLTATQVVDTLSKAADASSIGVGQISESFSMASAVFGASGQSLESLTTAIGILGNAGLKGSDAGTALKTMLLSLMAPSDHAAAMMKEYGIAVRDASGQIVPMRQIIQVLAERLGGLDQAARDEALKKIFGSDAIRAGLILLNKGVHGWDDFTQKLDGSLSVGKKFSIMTGTLKGTLDRLWAALQRIGASVGEALSGPLSELAASVLRYLAMFERMIAENKDLVISAAKIVGIIALVGGALVAVGLAGSLLASVFGGIASIIAGVGTVIGWLGSVLAALLSPIGLVITGIVALAAYLVYATGIGGKALAWLSERFQELKDFATASFQGIADALAAGDMALAARILWLSLQLVWQKGVAVLTQTWLAFKGWFLQTTSDIFFGAVVIVSDLFFGLKKAWAVTVNFWADLLAKFASLFVRTWNSLNSWVAKQWTKVLATFDSSINVESVNKRIDQETERRNIEVSKKTLDARLDREKELAEIEKERQGTKAAIAGLADAQDAPRREQNAKGMREAEDALVSARKEWQDAIDEARTKRAAVESGAGSPDSPEGIGDQLRRSVENAIPALQQAARSAFDVTGTFNAEAAFGLGLGNSAQERTARASEETARNTKRIFQSLEGGQAVFE